MKNSVSLELFQKINPLIHSQSSSTTQLCSEVSMGMAGIVGMLSGHSHAKQIDMALEALLKTVAYALNSVTEQIEGEQSKKCTDEYEISGG